MNSNCTTIMTRAILVMLVIGLAATVPSQARAQCTPPTIDGSLQDMFDFANCADLVGCGLIQDDDAVKDVCFSDGEFCVGQEGTCSTGSPYFATGYDIATSVVAYDAAAQTLYLGIRLRTDGVNGNQVIGDADGGGTCDVDCTGSPDLVFDEPGIGFLEAYNWFINTDCQGSPEILIEVSNNAITVGGAAFTSADFAYVCGNGGRGGSDLEAIVTGISLPRVFEWTSAAGRQLDGLSEDFTPPSRGCEPDLCLTVDCQGPTTICPGAQANYTVTVENCSEVALDNVTLTIPIPAGLSFCGFVDTDGWDTAESVSATLIMTEANMPVGVSYTVVFCLQAAADCVGSKSVVASVEGNWSQPPCTDLLTVGPETSTCTVTCLEAPPDPSCRVEGPTAVCPGATYTNTIFATNNSTTETLIMRITGPGGFSMDCGPVGPGQTCSVTDTNTAPSVCTTITDCYNAQAIGGACGDSGLSNDCCITINCLEAPPAPSCRVVGPREVCPGSTYTNTIYGFNNSTTETLTMVFSGPGGFTDSCVVGPQQECSVTHVRTAPSDCTTIEDCYTVRATGGACGDSPTSAPCCNTVTCTPPDVEITKTAAPLEVPVDGSYEITLEICNRGTSVLDPIEVCDVMPPGVGFDPTQTIRGTCQVDIDSANQDGTTGAWTVCFTSFSLNPGQCCTIVYTVTCDDAGSMTDVATARGYCAGSTTSFDEDSDDATVLCVPQGGACPRTPGFWWQQCYCRQGEGGRVKFSCAEMALITDCMDDVSLFLDWPDDDDDRLAAFCRMIKAGRQEWDQRSQAKRQFVAFLANHCVGVLDIPANNGNVVSLPASTPIMSGYCETFGTTIGEVAGAVDAELIRLEGESMLHQWVKDAYTDIIDCLDAINNGIAVNVDPEECQGTENTGDVGGSAFATGEPILNPEAKGVVMVSDSTRMEYLVTGADGAMVEVAIFDLMGNRVRTLVTEYHPSGRYEVSWDGRDDRGAAVKTAPYNYRLVVDDDVTEIYIVYIR